MRQEVKISHTEPVEVLVEVNYNKKVFVLVFVNVKMAQRHCTTARPLDKSAATQYDRTTRAKRPEAPLQDCTTL